MKSRTKWLTFIAVLWFSCLFFLLYLASICDAQESSEIQKAKLVDCQAIQTDQVIPSGPRWNPILVCFWNVRIEGKTLIMWQAMETGHFGFVEGR